MVAIAGLLTLIVFGALKLYKLQAARDRHIASTYSLSGPEFEHYVARLMRRDGFLRVRVSGGPGDLGADITAFTPAGDKVVVQCKHLSSSLGSPDVQKFNGTAWSVHGADIALIVTSNWPTVPAARLAGQQGIILIDHPKLAAWGHDRIVPIDGWKWGPRHWWERFSIKGWWVPFQRWILWRLKALSQGKDGVDNLELTGRSLGVLGLTIHIIGGVAWVLFLSIRLCFLILRNALRIFR